jgi:PAS domain S-box-containing protein
VIQPGDDLRAPSMRSQFQSFAELADAADEGMYRLEHRPVLRYTYINRALSEMLECTLEDLQADNDLILRRTHPAEREKVLAGRTDPTATSWPMQLRWHRRDGTWVTLWIREVPIHDDDGELVAVVGLVRDVTARERVEAAIRDVLAREQAAAERLRRVDDLRQTFLRAVSHELRTPLTAVVGYAETLRYHRARLDDAQADALIERLLRNALRLRSLLDDLLDIDRLSRGSLTVETRPADLAQVVLAAIDAIDVAAGRVRVEAVPTTCRVDRAKVERIVDNLVTNALKHGGPGVTVWVRVGEEDGEGVIEVADDGVGIPAELRERIFQPFEQGAASATAPSPGTGLGLTLVREFVRLHDGRVEVDERDGGGARFRVRLPVGAVDDEDQGAE